MESMNERTPLVQRRYPLDVDLANNDEEEERKWTLREVKTFCLIIFCASVMCIGLLYTLGAGVHPEVVTGAAWSSRAAPLSTMNPEDLGVQTIDRPSASKPGPAFRALQNLSVPLPTNSWYENLFIGSDNTVAESSVFQVPYILDTAGRLVGIRTHPCHVQANTNMVMMNYEPANGVSLGAVEELDRQHYIHPQSHENSYPAISKLSIELEWNRPDGSLAMRAPIARGAPYTTMIYFNTTPSLFVERHIVGDIIVDPSDSDPPVTLRCGDGKFGQFSAQPVRVQRELKVHFDTSDMTWLVFFSEPALVECSHYDSTADILAMNLSPGAVSDLSSFFHLRALAPMELGVVRLAMSNNCTTGQNPQYCGPEHHAHDQKVFEQLLRTHAEVYPTGSADVEFTFPVDSSQEEELRLIFNWRPNRMSEIRQDAGIHKASIATPSGEAHLPSVELLMFALPHHQERMRSTAASSNLVQDAGCMPTIHGMACPAIGSVWSLVEHLHRLSFSATASPRQEMLSDLRQAAREELQSFRIPDNYMRGAGDTYFSGKLLARLGRVLVVADEMGLSQTDAWKNALHHLRQGVEIWLNGSAESPFLYDQAWGGLVMCGCDYVWSETQKRGYCANAVPACPAMSDMGANYGAGYYNDHHYHYGYHIHAAAVVAKYDATWGRQWFQHVLLLVRDIANPSNDDPFFPTWRHKDWYLGFSWASGIVTHQNRPYPNGRNQESVSEAIAAYEAVGLYGDVMQSIFDGSLQEEDKVLHDSALRMRDMGRLLMATEIRSAKTYWHVQSPNATGVTRVYPEIYQPKVVGMMWSMLAQLQTWFGKEPWKSYGIQLLPITVVSGARDDVPWMREMLPAYNESCMSDQVCMREGWTIPIYTSMATIGLWREAWQEVMRLPQEVYDSAGGNGHSRTNTLWYIATRPDPDSL